MEDPVYQTEIEPTNESQPSGATIVWLITFLMFLCAIGALSAIGPMIAGVVGW